MRKLIPWLLILAACQPETPPTMPVEVPDAGAADAAPALPPDMSAPMCARPCSDALPCNPSVWGVCVAGCCVCSPPDGGSCPASP